VAPVTDSAGITTLSSALGGYDRRCGGAYVVIGSADNGRAAAIGCRAHTGWAVFVVVAGSVVQPEVLLRGRAELGDPSGRVRKNVYQSARGLEPWVAAGLVEAAERIAAEQASRAIERTVKEASDVGGLVGSCAMVVGRLPGGARLESILASHALAHAAEGRLYQRALEQGAESRGLHAVAIPKRSIWEEGEAACGVAGEELRRRIDELRREIGPPWAEDQKLAALAAWITLARSS
jgi:NTP pyrophosphatase (non-canonical NTP hydrolase)